MCVFPLLFFVSAPVLILAHHYDDVVLVFLYVRVCEEKALVREECRELPGTGVVLPNRVVFYQEMMMRVCYNTHEINIYLTHAPKERNFIKKKSNEKKFYKSFLSVVFLFFFFTKGGLLTRVFSCDTTTWWFLLPRYLEISVFVRGMFRITRAFSRWLLSYLVGTIHP